ncbi:hypothetical protein G3M53_23970, partial [Streptomyces sp. SID7982]|nr:hypothetical protein [Streptomyces sp. SID7982]
HSVPALRVITDSRGEGGQVKDFWPEPGPAELDRRARVAGLYTGPGPVPPHIRDRTLRLVHALRQGFDNPGIDGNPSYDALLRGVGALELMWQADPDLGGMGLLTLDAFRLLSLWELRDHGQGRARVDADVVRSLLARAAAAPPGTTLSDFARLRPL